MITLPESLFGKGLKINKYGIGKNTKQCFGD